LKQVNWWLDPQFHKLIAVEGPVKWFQFATRYEERTSTASAETIRQGVSRMMAKAGDAIRLAKSLHPKLTSGKQQPSDVDEQEDNKETGFDARSRFGIREITARASQRYQGVLSSALFFLNNLAIDAGEAPLMPSSLNGQPESVVAAHILAVLMSLEWPSTLESPGLGPLAQYAAASCLRDNRPVTDIHSGSLPTRATELKFCNSSELEAVCSALMYALKSVMVVQAVFMPFSHPISFDLSRSGAIFAKIKHIATNLPSTATKMLQYTISQELTEARHGAAVCAITTSDTTPYAIGAQEISGAYGSAVSQAAVNICDLLRKAGVPGDVMEILTSLPSSQCLRLRPGLRDLSKFGLGSDENALSISAVDRSNFGEYISKLVKAHVRRCDDGSEKKSYVETLMELQQTLLFLIHISGGAPTRSSDLRVLQSIEPADGVRCAVALSETAICTHSVIEKTR
jgi:hypothetical protein